MTSQQNPAPETSNSSMDASTILADAAAVAAQLSVDASITAKQVIATAADVAAQEKERKKSERDEMKEVFVESLNRVFGEMTEAEQLINLKKVPFICVRINSIDTKLEGIILMMEEFKFVRKIVYSVAAIFGSLVVVVLGIFLNILLNK